MTERACTLVAIAGGSCAGKSWLARQLAESLGDAAGVVSLDDFYLDRSHLTPARRARLNFDHPRAIDWAAFEQALGRARAREPQELPVYDFSTHCPSGKARRLAPVEFLLVEGLWLLRSPKIRRHFDFSVFIDCPAGLRLARKLERDVAERGRTEDYALTQFHVHTEPMHQQFVAPQTRWADLVLDAPIQQAGVEAVLRRMRPSGRFPAVV